MNDFIRNIPEYDGIGIYALIAENGQMYIGSSKHVRTRIKQHNTTLKSSAKSEYHSCCSSALLGHTFECQIIKKFEYGSITPLQLIQAEKREIEKHNPSELLNSAKFYATSNSSIENIPISKPAPKKYHAAKNDYKTVIFKIRADKAERFKQYAEDNKTTPNALLRGYIYDCIGEPPTNENGGGSDEAGGTGEAGD